MLQAAPACPCEGAREDSDSDAQHAGDPVFKAYKQRSATCQAGAAREPPRGTGAGEDEQGYAQQRENYPESWSTVPEEAVQRCHGEKAADRQGRRQVDAHSQVQEEDGDGREHGIKDEKIGMMVLAKCCVKRCFQVEKQGAVRPVEVPEGDLTHQDPVQAVDVGHRVLIAYRLIRPVPCHRYTSCEHHTHQHQDERPLGWFVTQVTAQADHLPALHCSVWGLLRARASVQSQIVETCPERLNDTYFLRTLG